MDYTDKISVFSVFSVRNNKKIMVKVFSIKKIIVTLHGELKILAEKTINT
jgi:hypothetical protein